MMASSLSLAWAGLGDRVTSYNVLLQRTMALFIRLIIRLFQLIFSVGTMFFSHNKSVNSVFQLAYQHSRTGPMNGHVY
jgi:hypothetical protein